MRRRAEQDKDFDQIKQNLFDAGVSVLKAAQAQEEMFHTSLEALAEAYEDNMVEAPPLNAGKTTSETDSIAEVLRNQQLEAIAAKDFDTYVETEKKLQLLDELAVTRLEREARKLEAQVRIQSAQSQLAKPSATWTEATLKAKYKTLNTFREETGFSANKWKEAVEQMNQSA